MRAARGVNATARWLGAALALALSSCSAAHAPPKVGPPPLLPEPRRAVRISPLPEWYWEAVETGARGAPKVVDLPAAEASVVRVEGATRIWDELGPDGRERLLRDGLVVLSGAEAPRLHMGAFYMDVRDRRVPYVLTIDALAYAVHVAFEGALAEIDDAVLAPELEALVPMLDARLAAEEKGAGVEVREGLRLARGVMAVARGLLGDATALPSGLDPAVAQELAMVNAHAGPAPSALLGVPIDYGRFAAPDGAARPGSFRALAWLASAPLLLVAKSEARGAVVDVATSRLHARAAMLLARVTDRDVDPAVYGSWLRISRLLTFVWGRPDDLGPSDLADAASALGFDLEDPKHVANVVSVDRLRHRAARGRAPRVFDGSGAPGRPGVAMRLLGGHAPADSVALASMAAAHEARIPSSLDLAAWLEASEARASVHDSGGDAFVGYDAALAQAIMMRPSEDAPSRHASVYGSLLDALMIWLAPPRPAPLPPLRSLVSPVAQRAAIESALASWAYMRHDANPLSRPRPSRVASATNELRVTGAPLPAFVEVAPDVIARLVGAVGQMKRGLGALGGLAPTSKAMTTLAEVEDILRVALRVAARAANDEALSPEDEAALASMPARLARLEEPGEEGASPMVPLVAPIFTDAAGDRVLSIATGAVERAVMIVREPSSGRLLLATGAHVGAYELLEPRGQQSTDATHRARFWADVGAPGALPSRAAAFDALRLAR